MTIMKKDIPIESLPPLPKGVLEAYKNKQLVVFIGAGISRLMGCQGWERLSDDLVRSVCNPAAANQIITSDLDSKAKITIARRYAEKNGCENEFWTTFKKGITATNDQDIYTTIVRLGGTFITTNCDGLLVRHFPQSFTTNCTRESYIDNEDRDYVFCIHGNYGDGSKDDLSTLVFTVEEYLRAYATDSDLVDFLSYVLGKRHVLFIGYGLNEFEIISKAFKSRERVTEKHYLLQGFFSYEQELANAQAEYYQSLGVKLIPFSKDENGYEQQRAVLEYWIDQLYEETPYASRNIKKVTKALQSFNDVNKHIIKENLNRKDEQGETNLRAILEVLPSKPDCFKWIKFLIDNEIIYAEQVFDWNEEQVDRNTISDLVLTCLLNCPIDRPGYEETQDSIKAYICRSLECANDCESLDSIRLTILIFVAVKYGPIDTESFWKLWKQWLPGAADQKLILLEANIAAIKKWPITLQVKLLEDLFQTDEESEERIGYYWIEDASKIIARKTRVEVRVGAFKHCVCIINTRDDNHSFMHSLQERFTYYSTEYDTAIFGVLEVLWESFSQGIKTELCKYMIRAAKSTFGYQVALHFAGDINYTSVIDFKNNPLMVKSTFVDFYLWLHDVIKKMTVLDLETIYEWIGEADFGYQQFDDAELQKKCDKRVATYKYQLTKLLASGDDRYSEYINQFALNADIKKPTPIEDKESYYSVQTVNSKPLFPASIPNETTAHELHELVVCAAKRAGWNDLNYSYNEAYSQLLKRIDNKQLEEYTKYVLSLPVNQAVYLIKEIGQHDFLSKCTKTFLKKVLGKLKKLTKEKGLDEQILKDVSDSIVYILGKLHEYGWKNGEIFDFAVKLNPASLWSSVPGINEKMDYTNNILNISECRLYSIVIQSAANDSDDKTRDLFKKWYEKQCSSPRQYLFLLTCAFYYRMLLIIDMDWAHEVVLAHFRDQIYADELAICMTSQLNYISEYEADFISDGERIERVINLIDSKEVLERNGERFITCVVASYYFEYMNSLEYDRFVGLLPKRYARVVFKAYISQIQDNNPSKKTRILRKTYHALLMQGESEISQAFLNAISQSKKVNSQYWGLIEEAIQHTVIDQQLWFSIERCLKNTKRKNKHIRSTIESLCKRASNIKGIDVFRFDDILCNLARIKEFSSVSELARLAVHSKYHPTKYSKYDEAPEQFLKDYDIWYPMFR